MFLPLIPADKYRRFKNTFGIPLADPYWTRLLGFDVIEFDKFIDPKPGESVEDATRRLYGEEAVKLIKEIMDWERDQFAQRLAP